MAKGKRKSGKRTPSGRLSRAGKGPSLVRGNERAMARFDKFGQHATEALGRAYAAGLLRDPNDDGRAKERYDVAAALQSSWRKAFRQSFRSALNDNPRGVVEITETGGQIAAYRKMRGQIAFLDANGYGSWFHQFVLADHPDAGPWWLDNLLAWIDAAPGRTIGTLRNLYDAGKFSGLVAEMDILDLNIKALDALGTYRDSNGNERGLTAPRKYANAHTFHA